MASTEHTLKIKAVLDASQVQGKLNNLKSAPSVGGGIDKTMDLNNAITRLIQALDKMPSNIAKANSQSNGINLRQAGKFAVAYGLGRVGQSAYGLQEASGFDAPNWQKSAMNIGQGAVAGAAFGPIGAGIGAGLGAMQSALDYWTESLKKSVEELDEWNKSVREAAQFRQRREDYRGNKELESALNFQKRTGDTSRLLSLRDELNEKAAGLRKQLEQQDKNAASGEVASNAMQMQSDLEKTEASIRSINNTLEQIDKADKAQLERKKQKEQQEKEIKEREEKTRQQQVASMNEQFQSRLDALNASKEDERIASVIDKGNYGEIDAEKKKQQDIADWNENLFKQYSAIGMAEEDPTKKSEYLKKAAKAQEDMNDARSRSKSLESAQTSLAEQIASQIEASKETSLTSLDNTLNKFNADYSSGKSIGEEAYDVTQDLEKEQLDVTKAIEKHMQKVEEHQKLLIEVTRGLAGTGVLG